MEQKLRYNIVSRLAEHSPAIRVRIKKRVQKEMKVSKSTISRWLYVKENDDADMPARALYLFSIALNTTSEELFNH